MELHVKVVGWIFIVLGALGMLAAIAAGMFLGGMGAFVSTQPDEGAAAAGAFMGLLGAGVAVFLTITSLPGILAGWGILQGKNWGRILGIICAIIQLLGFPIGTAFGIYALWVLFNKESQPLFATA